MPREDRETNTEADAGRFEADRHDESLDDLYPDYDRGDNTLGWDNPPRAKEPTGLLAEAIVRARLARGQLTEAEAKRVIATLKGAAA